MAARKGSGAVGSSVRSMELTTEERERSARAAEGAGGDSGDSEDSEGTAVHWKRVWAISVMGAREAWAWAFCRRETR